MTHKNKKKTLYLISEDTNDKTPFILGFYHKKTAEHVIELLKELDDIYSFLYSNKFILSSIQVDESTYKECKTKGLSVKLHNKNNTINDDVYATSYENANYCRCIFEDEKIDVRSDIAFIEKLGEKRKSLLFTCSNPDKSDGVYTQALSIIAPESSTMYASIWEDIKGKHEPWINDMVFVNKDKLKDYIANDDVNCPKDDDYTIRIVPMHIQTRMLVDTIVNSEENNSVEVNGNELYKATMVYGIKEDKGIVLHGVFNQELAIKRIRELSKMKVNSKVIYYTQECLIDIHFHILKENKMVYYYVVGQNGLHTDNPLIVGFKHKEVAEKFIESTKLFTEHRPRYTYTLSSVELPDDFDFKFAIRNVKTNEIVAEENENTKRNICVTVIMEYLN